MGRKNILFKSVLLGLLIFLAGSSLVFGVNNDGYICNHNYHTFGDYQMTNGVGNYGNNRRYFWMTGFNTTFQGYTRNAVSQWVNTNPGYPNVTTSISIRETSTRSSAMFEFWNTYLGSGIYGKTTF